MRMATNQSSEISETHPTDLPISSLDEETTPGLREGKDRFEKSILQLPNVETKTNR
jgi:hypothetical protein